MIDKVCYKLDQRNPTEARQACKPATDDSAWAIVGSMFLNLYIVHGYSSLGAQQFENKNVVLNLKLSV